MTFKAVVVALIFDCQKSENRKKNVFCYENRLNQIDDHAICPDSKYQNLNRFNVEIEIMFYVKCDENRSIGIILD